MAVFDLIASLTQQSPVYTLHTRFNSLYAGSFLILPGLVGPYNLFWMLSFLQNPFLFLPFRPSAIIIVTSTPAIERLLSSLSQFRQKKEGTAASQIGNFLKKNYDFNRDRDRIAERYQTVLEIFRDQYNRRAVECPLAAADLRRRFSDHFGRNLSIELLGDLNAEKLKTSEGKITELAGSFLRSSSYSLKEIIDLLKMTPQQEAQTFC
ncbi:hypothetical protein ES703_56739 [subsurface metagenome]